MMDEAVCIACGKCCKKHWLLRLTSEHEKSLFGDAMVFGNFIWTDQCKYQVNNKCTIHEDSPQRCKEYFCEGRPI
jgi:Fe-S-cluster containining protein